MHKAIAFGFFVISIILGSMLVVAGAPAQITAFVWFGMIIIALGTINLAIKLTFVEETKRIETPKKKIIKKRKSRKK